MPKQEHRFPPPMNPLIIFWVILGSFFGHFWGHFLDHFLVTFWTTFGCHFGADGPGVIFTAGLGVIFTAAGLGINSKIGRAHV